MKSLHHAIAALFLVIILGMSAEAKPSPKTSLETATFGAGCFWGVEQTFLKLKGVKETAAGYEGGTLDNPTYQDVCTGRTDHAEVVQIKFDPKEISYEKLLDVFWTVHDPTQVNSQGPDHGSQYRTAIFAHTPEQHKVAAKSREALQNLPKYKNRRIATQIVPAEKFWIAEEYHQQYLKKRGLDFCHF